MFEDPKFWLLISFIIFFDTYVQAFQKYDDWWPRYKN